MKLTMTGNQYSLKANKRFHNKLSRCIEEYSCYFFKWMSTLKTQWMWWNCNIKPPSYIKMKNFTYTYILIILYILINVKEFWYLTTNYVSCPSQYLKYAECPLPSGPICNFIYVIHGLCMVALVQRAMEKHRRSKCNKRLVEFSTTN